MPYSTQKSSLLDNMRHLLRTQGYAYRTELTYCDWVERFITFHSIQSREPLFLTLSKLRFVMTKVKKRE